MPYEFTEWENEPQPQSSSSRAGKPPRKWTVAAVLDPPLPAPKPQSLIPRIMMLLGLVVVGLLLLGFLVLTVVAFFHHR